MKKKILVYPCGTEIGLEVYRSIKYSKHFELIGGSSSYDHGCFVYKNHIADLPFIKDNSSKKEILEFIEKIQEYNIDFIYPAMDGVLYKFCEYKKLFNCEIIAPDFETAEITRSKTKTYEHFESKILTPKIYATPESIDNFPVFIKPDVGQGSIGAKIIYNENELKQSLAESKTKMLIMEYLPKNEYTIDCFTNNQGKLIFAQGRERKRIKSGISVNSIKKEDKRFLTIANIINKNLNQKGGWFFQVKENDEGDFVLLEIASRIAGGSSFCRIAGANLPLMSAFCFDNQVIDNVIVNDFNIELDRALMNNYKIEIDYNHVYVDYDDTIIVDGKINIQLISFLFQCINEGKKIILITKHTYDLGAELKKRRLNNIFDEIIHLEKNDKKYIFIKENKAIFIDDSYIERATVHNKLKIHTFDTHQLGALIKEGEF